MECPPLSQLKLRRTEKWSNPDPELLPMFVAESDFHTCPEVLDALDECLDREILGYPHDDDTRLAEAFCDFARERYGWEIAPEAVALVSDVVRGLWEAVDIFTTPGSGIAVAVPSYPPFFDLPTLCDRPVHYVPAGPDGIDLADIEQAFAAGAGCFVLCNPHNPLGFTYSEEFLVNLADLAARYGARVISDEIHAPLVLEGTHIPAASVSPTAEKVTVTLTAGSKAWNVAGLKCAQMILTNPEDQARWAQLPAPHRQGYSILGYEAAIACYRADTSFLEKQKAQLRKNRDQAAKELPARIPGLKTNTPDATYLLWLDFRDTALGEDAVRLLLEHAKVQLSDGRAFMLGDRGAGLARMNLACSTETLEEAIDRMAALAQRAANGDL